MRGEGVNRNFVERLVGTEPKEGYNYEIIPTDAGFHVLERNGKTQLIENSFLVGGDPDSYEYLPQKEISKHYKRERIFSSIPIVIVFIVLLLMSLGGILCHLGIIA